MRVPGLQDVMTKVLCTRLRELRRDAEMTQRDISKRTGIHRPIISRIERGVHYASLETVFRYAAALDISAAVVLVCFDEEWIEAGKRVRFQMRCARPTKRVSARRVRVA